MADESIDTSNWKDISTEQAYKMTMAEFKGATIQALQDMKDDIKEMQQDAKVRNWITFGIGSLSGLIAAIITSLGMKH